jgi:predicted SprT family Zn-dependent metalloprotease
MQAEFNAPVHLWRLFPRVLGHGGFTSQEITISYFRSQLHQLDATRMILRHELAHYIWMDSWVATFALTIYGRRCGCLHQRRSF